MTAQVKRTAHEDELFGYLAKFIPLTNPQYCKRLDVHERTDLKADMRNDGS